MSAESEGLQENSCLFADDSEDFVRFKTHNGKEKNSAFCTITYIPPPEEAVLEREGWTSKWDFLFSCISLSVGLGNVWRFPYLCYKNGGGAFLVTYSIAMILCGIPLFFQEVAVGQYLGSGGLTFVGQLCPLLKGVGYATMTIVFLLDIYYCVIISWTLYYIMSTFVSMPDVPWRTCGNSWNTEYCTSIDMTLDQRNVSFVVRASNVSFINDTRRLATPVEEFFDHNVLGITEGIENVGEMQWKLLVCLGLGWIFIYWIIRNGLHQSGKIIWFTALFPYVVLFVLLIRALLLDGAVDGLLYFVVPRWEELLHPEPWMEGATQIFFAYSIGCGALPVLGSYNRFHHNCYKDSIITCIINTLTSILAGCVTFAILGYLALEKGTTVAEVVTSGPGLVFLTYPEVVLKLPWMSFWALMFFFMLLMLGTDSAFCLVEAFIAGVLDNWSDTLRPHKEKFRVLICVLMFLLGVPMITQGGMYIFQLMDCYSASGMSLLWVCFFQTVAISWIFGTKKLCDCIEQMMGFRPSKFWTICWQICAPLIMLAIFVFQCFQYRRLTYGSDYEYPWWAEIIGFLLSCSSMIWVPLYAIYYVCKGSGSLWENFKEGLEPNIKQRKLSIKDKQAGYLISESTVAEGVET